MQKMQMRQLLILMTMCNINNRKQSLSSNLIINENQSFLLERLTEDDMKANVKQTNQINNNNDSEYFLSDLFKMLTQR